MQEKRSPSLRQRHRLALSIHAALMCGLFSAPPSAHAQCAFDLPEALIATSNPGDAQGSAVALSGQFAFVGAPGTSDGGDVYVYELVGGSWIPSTSLTSLDRTSDDQFGFSLAATSDRLCIGAPGDDRDTLRTGAVYAFDFDGASWSEAQKLEPSSVSTGDARFGASIDVEADRLIVGSPGDTQNGSQAGAAYIYEHDGVGWIEVARLVPAEVGASDVFGASVGISGDWAIVGATGDDDSGSDAGAAYLFNRDGTGTWNHVDKIVGSNPFNNRFFGQDVGIDGSVAAIAAPGVFEGDIYIFEEDQGTWSEQRRFEDNSLGGLGRHVTVAQSRVAAGAVFSSSVVILEKLGAQWLESTQVGEGDSFPGESFGASVALLDDRLLTGAPDAGGGEGAAYVTALICDGPRFVREGTCPGPLIFAVAGATPGKSVAFVYAFGTGATPIPSGNPCAGTVLGLNRTAVLAGVVQASPNGLAVLTAGAPPQACGTVFMQAMDVSTCTVTNLIEF